MAIPKQKLKLINEFREILSGYTPSADSIGLLRSTKLVILVGPTAAGRNTLIGLLQDTNRYHYIVSDTTRQPRMNNDKLEQNGVEYWFKSEEKFLNGLKNGEYIEAAIIHEQQVSGNSVREIIKANQQGKIAINEVQPDGAKAISGFKPDTLVVFLLPPSFDVWMERLRARGDMYDDELERRLNSAVDEIRHALETDFYHFVINNEIHEAAQAVDELATGRLPDTEKQQKGRNHAEQLVVDVQFYLRKN